MTQTKFLCDICRKALRDRESGKETPHLQDKYWEKESWERMEAWFSQNYFDPNRREGWKSLWGMTRSHFENHLTKAYRSQRTKILQEVEKMKPTRDTGVIIEAGERDIRDTSLKSLVRMGYASALKDIEALLTEETNP